MAWKKEEKLDSRCIVSLGFRFCSRGRQRTGSRSSRGTVPIRRGTRRGRHAIFAAIFHAGDHLRAQPISRAFRRICCAEKIGFVYEEVLPRSVRSSPLENSPPIPGAPLANIPAQGSAPRRAGPCRHRSLSTVSVGSQNRCLGMAGQTAPALGEQTVSTTQNQISSNEIWMWPETIALVR